MKPLLRWTVGNNLPLGIKVLSESVRTAKLIYGDTFDFVICYNHLTDNDLNHIQTLGVATHAQHPSEIPIAIHTERGAGNLDGTGWKLCPPRLRPDGHELWLDNDVILQRRMSDLDAWLKSDKAIISHCDGRHYGAFDQFVPPSCDICGGFFGFPPGVDLGKRMVDLAKGRLIKAYDEHGLTCACVTASPFMITYQVALYGWGPVPNAPALHFAGINRAERHDGWNEYKRKKALLL